MPTRHLAPICALAAALIFAGCEVGPDYKRPATETPPAFSEAAPWHEAVPKDTVSRAGWWKVFNDPALDSLETQAESANPTVQAAFARVEQAQDLVKVSVGALLPNVSANAAPTRTRYSGSRQLPPGSPDFPYTTDSIDTSLSLNYEVDLFGQVRRELEAGRALAQAQEAAYQSVLLSLEADVATDYYTLRGLLQQRSYLSATVKGRQHELSLVQDRQKAGASDNLDVYRAQTDLTSVQSTLIATDQQIAQVRHALAILVGKLPESFDLETTALAGDPPAVPLGLPSDLLERRPDIAQAERTLAAANASIGVAKAAFFPSVSLTAFGGFNSTAFHTLFESGSREWSIAPFISLPLFQGGRNWANYQRSKAAYDEAVANYRQQVLVAFRDVEDSLSGLRYLSSQSDVLQQGVSASQKATDLSLLRYKQGVADYFEVIDAERDMLSDQLLWSQVQTQRFSDTILLIKSLGGGWN